MREGWETKNFGSVCSFVRGPFGGSLKKSMFVDDGYAVYEQQHAINNQFENIRYFVDDKKFQEMKRFELLSGELIMSCSGTMGKVAKVPNGIKQGIINQALLKISANESLDTNFLIYWMESPDFQYQLAAETTGVAIKNVASVKVLKEIPIPLPPLAEQKRIVAVLDKAFEGIAVALANAEKNLANARELFETTLNVTFNQKGEGWVKTTLGETCDFSNGKAHEKDIDENGRYIVVNSKFISREGSVVKRTNELKHPLFIDDIVMVMSDVPKGRALAKCFLIQEDNKYSLNQRICSIRSNNYFPKFLIYQLSRHPYLLSFDNKGSQANLRKADILSCPLFLPSFDDQKSVATRLDSLSTQTQRLEVLYQQKINALNELKQSLLQKAFAGELTADMAEAKVAEAVA